MWITACFVPMINDGNDDGFDVGMDCQKIISISTQSEFALLFIRGSSLMVGVYMDFGGVIL